MKGSRKLSVAVKIGAGFGLVIVLLIVVGAVGFFALGGAERNFEDTEDTAQQNDLAASIRSNMLGVEVVRLKYIQTSTPKS